MAEPRHLDASKFKELKIPLCLPAMHLRLVSAIRGARELVREWRVEDRSRYRDSNFSSPDHRRRVISETSFVAMITS